MKQIELYTAISCKGTAPQTGGLGVIVKYKDVEKEVAHGLKMTKSSRLEILSVIMGLEILKEPCQVTVYLKNQNLADTYEKKWINNWIKKGLLWQETKRVQNKDLHIELFALTEKHEVKFIRYDLSNASPEIEKRAKDIALREAQRTDLELDAAKAIEKPDLKIELREYTEEERKELQRIKSARGAWHSKHIKEVTEIFGNTCQMCGCNPPEKKGVAHHLSYPKDYWLIPLEQKIKDKIITFVCRPCHQKAHTGNSYQDYKEDKLKHGGHCQVCNGFAPKMWKRFHPDSFPFALCKTCLKDLKEGRLTLTNKESTNTQHQL